MELDDLKKMADLATENYKPVNNNTMELINHKSQSTLAHLAQKIKMSLFPFPITVVLFSIVFGTNAQAFHSVLMWMLLGILFIEFINLLFSYGLVKKLQDPSGSTKENLIAKISSLQKSFKNQSLITLNLYSLMAVVLEMVMYYHADANFSGWFEIPVVLRISFYFVFLVIQFILKKYFYKKQFGKHLENLKNLLQELI